MTLIPPTGLINRHSSCAHTEWYFRLAPGEEWGVPFPGKWVRRAASELGGW